MIAEKPGVRGAVVSSAGAPSSILPQICLDMKRQEANSVVKDSGWSAYVNSSAARQKELSIGECAFAVPAESLVVTDSARVNSTMDLSSFPADL
uniref:Uncharacterized protein n=1 Tax=Wuchereria bancrofti TaxID=6293 RepID=A0AAF5RVC1_WUCBA